MEQEPLRRLIRSLRTLAEAPGSERLGDDHLLERFVVGRDQAAFELLVWRHGPMVLGVCRRLLPDPQDAEDAFQATWLTLVRKAGSIARGAAVGSWLYRVAYRVALRARAERAKRARRERPEVEQLAAPPEPPGDGEELLRVLDEEVDRLPARQRSAFVLCCLEGRTGDEAARQLGCSPGTVSSRLTRAREQLRRRLTRRGLAPAAVLGVGLAGEGWAASLPEPLVDTTLKAALSYATGTAAGGALSPHAVTLTEGVLRAMFLTRVKIATLLLLLAGLLAAGGTLTRHALTAAPREGVAEEGPTRRTTAPKGEKPHEGAVVVRTVKPKPGGLDLISIQTCTVHAADQEDIFPVVSGVLEGLKVDLGSRVKKGQVLAVIDAPPLELEAKRSAISLKQAESQVQGAESRVVIAQADVQAAQTVVAQKQAEVASAQAAVKYRQQMYERLRRLKAVGGAVDQITVDEAQRNLEAAKADVPVAAAALDTAKAKVKLAETRVNQARAAVESAKADLEAAKIDLEKARYRLGLTRIKSPVDGIVTRRNYRNGHYVRADEQGNRLPLLTIMEVDPVRVVVQIPDRDVPLTEIGAAVKLDFDALPGVQLTGKVSRIGFAEDPTSHKMRAEIDVPNPKGRLRPGMHGGAIVILKKGSPNAVRIPSTCLETIFTDNKPPKHWVHVVRDGKAYRTPVQVSKDNGTEVEVLSGLKPTDQVVVQSSADLVGDEVPVKVEDTPAPKEGRPKR